MQTKLLFPLLLGLSVQVSAPAPARAQGTGFTYQGQLKLGGNPANGLYDFRFAVYDNLSGGTQQGPLLGKPATGVTNGLFTAALDFGGVFSGANRWLEIAVSTNGAGNYTTLTPRQALQPTPYAITAAGVPAGGITTAMLAVGAVTTDKIALGAVRLSQIDDGGGGAFSDFQAAIQSVGGTNALAFSDLRAVVATNAVTPTLTLTVNGASFGTVAGFSGSEGISRPYRYCVQVQSAAAALDPATKIGLPAQLTFTRNGRTTSFSGTVTACTRSGSTGNGLQYTLCIEPSLAYLALATDYRIYQNLAVPDVAAAVCQNFGLSLPVQVLGTSYPVHENVIQYSETTLNFFSRVLEYEGIFYFFDHSQSPPALLLGDAPGAYLTAPNSPFAYYGDTATAIPAGVEYIRSFENAVHQSTLRSTVDNYDFQKPALSLAAVANDTAGVGETYEFGPPVKTLTYDQLLAGVRRDRHRVERATLSGSSTAPDLRAGYVLTLNDQTGAGLSGNYLVTGVRAAGFVRVTNGVTTVFYGNQFDAIPGSLTYRPATATPRPLAQPSTAVVTGPAGETTYVDSRGRVKVQFHWDRYGKDNELSSAWLRVASPMAGASHGALFLPQVGDEVLVSFIQGDPDQPVVTGSLFNGANPPPYSLPANKTVSTIKSVSTDSQVNEIRFEDLAGSQLLLVHAAKDLALQAGRQILLASPVAIGAGTLLTNLQAGQIIVGSSTGGTTTCTITFPRAFSTTPKVLLTTNNDPGWNVGDTFVATARVVSTTSCQANIVRVDSANGWSQSLRLNWIAWE